MKKLLASLLLSVLTTASQAEDGQKDVQITFDELNTFRLPSEAQSPFSAQNQNRFNYVTIFCSAVEKDGPHIVNLEFFPTEEYILSSNNYHAQKAKESPSKYRHVWEEMAIRQTTTFNEIIEDYSKPDTWYPIPKGQKKLNYNGVVSPDGGIKIFNNHADVENLKNDGNFDASGMVNDKEARAIIVKTAHAQCGFGF